MELNTTTPTTTRLLIHIMNTTASLRGNNHTRHSIVKEDEFAGIGVVIAFLIFFVVAGWGGIVRGCASCCNRPARR